MPLRIHQSPIESYGRTKKRKNQSRALVYIVSKDFFVSRVLLSIVCGLGESLLSPLRVGRGINEREKIKFPVTPCLRASRPFVETPAHMGHANPWTANPWTSGPRKDVGVYRLGDTGDTEETAERGKSKCMLRCSL